MTEFNQEVGHRLKVARVDACMTQESLAEAAKVSVATIVNTERGKTMPTLATAHAIASALGCTVNDLCGIGK